MNLAAGNLLQDKTRLLLSVVGVALAIVLVLIVTGWLGLVLICTLMMFFMMQGMHGSQDDHGHSAAPQRPGTQDRSKR